MNGIRRHLHFQKVRDGILKLSLDELINKDLNAYKN